MNGEFFDNVREGKTLKIKMFVSINNIHFIKRFYIFSLLFVLIYPCVQIHAATTASITINAAMSVTAMPVNLFGQNINVYESTADGTDTDFDAAVKATGAPLMRFPGGGYGDMVDWQTMTSCSNSWLPITKEKGISFANACNTQLQCIVNYAGYWCGAYQGHAAAVTKAADWVRYMNITNGGAHRVDYWEVGNETFGSGEQGFTSDDVAGGTTYGTNFIDFYNAMKAVDPTIKVGMQCQFDHGNFSRGALAAVKGKVVPDFFIAHAYPIWMESRTTGESWDTTLYASNPVIDGRIMDNVNLAVSCTAQMNSLVSTYFGSSYVGKIPYWMTEFRSVTNYKYDEFVDTMFCAQFLLELGRLGWGGANIWDIKNGYTMSTGEDFGLLRSGANSGYSDDLPKNGPRPTYYIYPYLSQVFGKNMVSCSYPSYVSITAAGSYPQDYILNTTTGNKVRAWASKDTSGNLTIFIANNDWNNTATVTLNISNFTAGTAGQSWTFQGAGTTYAGGTTPLVQRLHISINGTTDPAISSLPGTGTSVTTGSSFSVTMPLASMMLIKVPFGGTATPTATITRTVTGTTTATCTRTGTITYTFTPSRTPTYTRTYTFTLTSSATSTITFSPSFTRTATGTATPADTSTFTSTPSRTFTGTNTPSNTCTNTPTRTFTLTNTPTLTNTATGSFTGTETATCTDTLTATATKTVKFTSTNTPENTPSYTDTATDTCTQTKTSTGTVTPSMTFTLTNTPTGTNTATGTFTLTHTPTHTNTATGTFTLTHTPTSTITLTGTITYTDTPGNTPVYTDTGTNTPEKTPSFIITMTCSASPTFTQPVITRSETLTASKTATVTASFSSSSTPAFTETITATPVPVLTPSFTPAVLQDGGFAVNDVVLFPNPYNPEKGNLYIRVNMTGRVDKIKVRMYTVSFRLIIETAPSYTGTDTVILILPPAVLKRLSIGTYYVLVSTGSASGKKAASKPHLLVVLK